MRDLAYSGICDVFPLAFQVSSMTFAWWRPQLIISLGARRVQHRMGVSSPTSLYHLVQCSLIVPTNRCGCLHLPSFIQQCQQVLSNPIRNPMSIENAAFLSLLAACLCVTVHLMEDASAVELGLSPMARDSLAADLNAIMESAWQRGDFMQNHRMEFLQAYM